MSKRTKFIIAEVVFILVMATVLAASIIAVWGAYQDRLIDSSIINTMNDIAYYAESINIRDGHYGNLIHEARVHALRSNLPEGLKETFILIAGADEVGVSNKKYCAAVKMLLDGFYCIDSQKGSGLYELNRCSLKNPSCR